MREMWWPVLLAAFAWACSGEPAPSPTAASPPPTTSPAPETSTSAAATTEATDEGSARPEAETVLRIGSTVRATSLDPAGAFTLHDFELLQAIGTGLLTRSPGDGGLVPGIAAGLPEVSGDGRSYTFELHPDLSFADGTELSAETYVDGLSRVMSLGGDGSSLVTSIVAGVEAVGETTVVFTLHDDYAFFPTVVANAQFLPVHPDAYNPDQIEPFPAPPVYGTGNWVLAGYGPDEVVLERSALSEDEEGPESVVISYFDTSDEMLAAFAEGELDVLWRGVDGSMATLLGDMPGTQFVEIPGGTLHFLTVNHEKEPTDDPSVRKAIAMVIDRADAGTAAFGEAAGTPAYSPLPSGFLGHVDAFRAEYGEADVATAIELLTEAGYTEEDPAELHLGYPPERFGVEVATAMEQIEQQLEATGLIDVTLTAQPWNTYVGDVIQGKFNLGFLGWLHDFPDPHNYLAPFLLDEGVGGTVDPSEKTLAELLRDAAAETNETTRAEIYHDLQLLWADDVVTIPLWVDHEYVAYRDHVTGDPGLPSPETLNIGPSLLLDYAVISLGEISPAEDA